MIKVDTHHQRDGSADAGVIRSILQFQARQAVDGVADLTDNSGGSDGTLAAGTVATNVAASGTDLAGKATTETALGTVADAVATLAAKYNAIATILGLTAIVDNSGGASGGDTLAAVTVSVTGAATGAQATEYNASVDAIEAAFHTLASHANMVAAATGGATDSVAGLSGNTYSATIAAIPTDVGTAADPGVTKAVVDADLATFADNAATIAATLNAAVAGAGSPGAVAV